MAAAGAPAQHCTGMANWPNTIQCLGSDDIMSLDIESSAFLRVLALKTFQEFGAMSAMKTVDLSNVLQELSLKGAIACSLFFPQPGLLGGFLQSTKDIG